MRIVDGWKGLVDFEVDISVIRLIENALIVDFKRLSRAYSTPLSLSDDDTIAWVALMRHYGAPTRFLDFTYSLFIAAYFAAEAERGQPVVWAVNKSWLGKQCMHVVSAAYSKHDADKLLEAWGNREGWVFDKLFLTPKPPVRCVWPVSPFAFNDRLAAQQGLFLCANDVAVPFHETLEALPDSRDNVLAIQTKDNTARCEVLRKLYRTRTSRETLLPGFQGFAESLRLRIPVILRLEEIRKGGARLGPNVTGV
ncbi:MAG: FRG domain-containing protein [Acidobacteriota bacterium]